MPLIAEEHWEPSNDQVCKLVIEYWMEGGYNKGVHELLSYINAKISDYYCPKLGKENKRKEEETKFILKYKISVSFGGVPLDRSIFLFWKVAGQYRN